MSWHKLTVHERVYKRSGTDKCPICSQKESVNHAMVECSMFKAVTAVIQHYYGPVDTGDGKSQVRDMMESNQQEWLLSTDQGCAMWSARNAHWRYRCEVKAGASPVFTSYLTTWPRELWIGLGFTLENVGNSGEVSSNRWSNFGIRECSHNKGKYV